MTVWVWKGEWHGMCEQSMAPVPGMHLPLGPLPLPEEDGLAIDVPFRLFRALRPLSQVLRCPRTPGKRVLTH